MKTLLVDRTDSTASNTTLLPKASTSWAGGRGTGRKSHQTHRTRGAPRATWRGMRARSARTVLQLCTNSAAKMTTEPMDSTSTAAAAAMPDIRAAVDHVGNTIGATASGVDGYAAVAADVGTLSTGDLFLIIPIVMLVLALLLAAVLRSLVAPLYLVVSVGLSYLASLGFAVLVFVVIGGQDGINFVLPFFMFLFIMALGQDYNILVMTRIREEAHHAPIRLAVRSAVGATGTTVTSAGLILAGTFGVLTATGDIQIIEIGVGLAAGILLDTFVVRTLLVPSAAVLLGRWNWWPSWMSHTDRDYGSALPDPEWLIGHPAGGFGTVGPLYEPSTVSGRGQPTQTL